MKRSRPGQLQNCHLWAAGGGHGQRVTAGGEIVAAGGGVGGDGGQGSSVDYHGVAAQLEGRQQLRRFVRSWKGDER